MGWGGDGEDTSTWCWWKTCGICVCVLMLMWDFKFNPVIQMFVKMVKNAASEMLNWVCSLQGRIVRIEFSVSCSCCSLCELCMPFSNQPPLHLADPESGAGPWRLHERPVPCLHWWHCGARGHAQTGGWCPHCGGNSGTCLRHDQSPCPG